MTPPMTPPVTSVPNGPPPATRSPSNVAEAAAALADTHGRVLIRGAGTAHDWAGTPARPDLVLDTTRMTGVLAHNPKDMTVEVRAGIPLRELNAQLAEHGQRVALDAARVARGATVGGLIATADTGPITLTYGSMRDLVIGALVVLADGTPARTGSHVIKNVAGYDLAKLVHGCHGTLALIAEVVFRLHPLPEATTTVRLPCSLDDAVDAAAAVLASPLEPTAVQWCAGGLLIQLEGGATALAARAQRVTEVLGADARRLSEDAAKDAWAEYAARVDDPPDGCAMLRVGCRPSLLAPLMGELTAKLDGGQITAGLATGIGTLALPAEPAAIADAHQRVHAVGGTSMLRARPPGCELPAWGPAPSSVGVLRTLRDELDPDGRLGTGRFAPWLDKAEVT